MGYSEGLGFSNMCEMSDSREQHFEIGLRFRSGCDDGLRDFLHLQPNTGAIGAAGQFPVNSKAPRLSTVAAGRMPFRG